MHASAAGCFWCRGAFGAPVYDVQHAASFAARLLGIVRAVFWPAVLMYTLLEVLKM